MASTTTDQESALHESALNLLNATTRSAQSSDEIERAIASAHRVFHAAVAQFARSFNRTRQTCGWHKLPAELKLEVVRKLPFPHMMLGISHDIRALVLSDPSLWTTISTPRISDDARTDFLRRMVARSGNRPVDIIWTDPWDFWRSSPAPPRDIILQTLPRARTLTLDVSYFAPGRVGFWSSSAPLLEQLTVTQQTMPHYLVLRDTWTGDIMPTLRELKLPTITIDGPPRSPFESVLSLEVDISVSTMGIEWLWNWFPNVQTLVLDVCGHDAPRIPPPPVSLRHVILRPTSYCPNPTRALMGWRIHGVKLLEMFVPFGALEVGLNFLDPGRPWKASFTAACEPRGLWSNVSVVQDGALTLVFWSKTSYDQCMQLGEEGLTDRFETLTLGEELLQAAFRDDVAFPALRSLTATGFGDLSSIPQGRDRILRAPELEEFIVDLTSEAVPQNLLAHVSGLAARIESTHLLREIVLRLPDDFDRHSPAITNLSLRLVGRAPKIRIEYYPKAQCHQDPCFCSALQL